MINRMISKRNKIIEWLALTLNRGASKEVYLNHVIHRNISGWVNLSYNISIIGIRLVQSYI
jgi:hypothetical protein